MLGGIWIRSGPACWYSVGRRAPVLNAATVAAAQALTAAGVQILHVYGPNNTDQVEGITDLPDYHGVPTSTAWMTRTRPPTWPCAAPVP